MAEEVRVWVWVSSWALEPSLADDSDSLQSARMAFTILRQALSLLSL